MVMPDVFCNCAHLYYKEQGKLKMFPTQIGSIVPLTLDPRVNIKRDGKMVKPTKTVFREYFCQNRIVFSPSSVLPTPLHPRITEGVCVMVRCVPANQ